MYVETQELLNTLYLQENLARALDELGTPGESCENSQNSGQIFGREYEELALLSPIAPRVGQSIAILAETSHPSIESSNGSAESFSRDEQW